MRLRIALCALALVLPSTLLSAQTASLAPTPNAATAATVVPALIRYAGTAIRTDGKPQTGEAATTFTIYRDETGGNPLWIETQLVTFDALGRYEAHLGATNANGLPSSLFSGGDARWLEVTVAGSAPQTRILLVSVPYAMKAADAATLGGLPASAFALKDSLSATAALPPISPAASDTSVNTPGGALGYIPVFIGSNTIENSPIFQYATSIGIGTTSPQSTLDVNGGITARGIFTMGPVGSATPSAGSDSQAFRLMTNVFNSATQSIATPLFKFQAEPAGNNTPNPSATFNLLYGNGLSLAGETGFSIASTGIVHFAPGQTFPGGGGSGTITGITTTSPLSGGGTTGSIALSLNIPTLETTLNARYAQLTAPNTFNAPITFAPGQTFPGTGTGTITGITAGTGLKGGGTTGALTLSLDPTVVPTLTGGPVFSGGSHSGIVGGTDGTSGYTAGVLGYAGTRTSVQAITGVWGDSANHDGVTGTSTGYVGVHGISASGDGVVGNSNGTQLGTAGVLGTAGNRTGFNGIAAVWGDADAHAGVFGSSNQYSGVIGQSTSGPGVYGSSVSGYGAQFTAAGINAAVYATNTTAAGGNGIFATSTGTDSNTIYANSTGGGSAAISGIATGGSDSNGTPSTGVVGYSSSGSGVFGTTTGTVLQTAGTLGVAGSRTSFSGIGGVWGDASTHVGTIGTSDQYAGVQGQSTNSFGVQGISPNYVGVFGVGGSSDPSIFTNINVKGSQIGAWGDVSGDPLTPGDVPIAVVGTATNGIGGYFQNNSEIDTVSVFNYDGNNVQRLFKTFKAASPDGICGFGSGGNLTCTGQIKTLATTSNGARTVETYSMQSPENWMEDFGSGNLSNGSATITIDAAFADTVTASADYHVFLTPNGDSKGLYIAQKSATTFVVRESGSGKSSIAFDYRIVAKRRGLEAQRMVDVTDRLKVEQKGTPMDKSSSTSAEVKAPR